MDLYLHADFPEIVKRIDSMKEMLVKNTGSSIINAIRPMRDVYRELFDPFPYRRYARKKRCIYVHIPKTAGTSILNYLGYYGGRDHCTYREFLKASPSRFSKYFNSGGIFFK